MKITLISLLFVFSIFESQAKTEFQKVPESDTLKTDSLENEKRKFRNEMSQELESILNYWIKNSIDKENGGFIGKVDGNDKVYPNADKGLVLNSRILWTFSAAYIHNPKPEYKMMADRSYTYLMKYFWDKKNGGGYWSVDYLGKPKEKHKQMYGQGFMLYGLSEYYRAFGNKSALNTAITLFKLIEKHGYDTKNGGYFEVATEDWKITEDKVITQGKSDQKKSMNTHLHIIEPYTNLYRVWKDPFLKKQLYGLLTNFTENIIDKNTKTQILFLTDDWQPRSEIISYGHDIEASWLLLETAEVLHDKTWIEKIKPFSIGLSDAAQKGIDNDGGMFYEIDGSHLKTQKDWWPQAEAMVGFYNSYQISSDLKYFNQSRKSWDFIKKNLLTATGEWYWGVDANGKPLTNMDKIGMWKCPYHNARACMEMIRRLE
ncbi:AGE family epimerase/isomerase [Lacihabitans sp. CCS-44]|uniref:AGE family epimerase/isomerase n=1 Tax=Lacihabitans sp. CCS-44 TaxID=2487331 RepID=UPI0020CEA34E|nr:AGE family epimerase/isomerase [Lacihabitans sp. CCS-44]